MTLDDLIEALCDLRQQHPSAGTATVSVKYWDEIAWRIQYDAATVWLFEEEMTEEDKQEPGEPSPPPGVRTRKEVRDGLRVIERQDSDLS